MNWDAISAVGEIVGACGVIASLLYVGVQIRADGRARLAATIHDQSEALGNLMAALFGDGELSDIYFRGIQDFNSLEGVELVRFSAFFGKAFRVYEDAFFHHRDGLLDAEIWRGLCGPVEDLLAYPGVQSWWNARKHHYSPDLHLHVARLLGEDREQRLYRKVDS